VGFASGVVDVVVAWIDDDDDGGILDVALGV
jgi:hypothetical protein